MVVNRNRVDTDGVTVEMTSELHLTSLQDSDAGLYQCLVSNRLGTAYSAKANITVNGKYSHSHSQQGQGQGQDHNRVSGNEVSSQVLKTSKRGKSSLCTEE